MADKTLKTRISLKYGAIGEWSSTFKPLKGEVCLAEVPTEKKDAAGNIVSVPAVVFKVGDGKKNFGDLPWASALAADVYDWAKQSKNDFVNTFLNLTMTDGTTMQSKLDAIFATDAELAKAIGDLRAEIPTQLGVMSIEVTDDNVVIGTPEEATTGNVKIELKHKKYEKAGTTSDVNGDAITAGASVTIKVPTLKIDEYGHTEFDGETSHTITIPSEVAVGDGNITISAGDGLAEGGTFNVNQDKDATITLKHADTSSVANVTKADRTYVSGLTFDDFGHVTAVEVGTESVKNTAHTHAVGNGLKQNSNGGISGEVLTELNLAFVDDNDNKLLKLVDATDTTKVIAEFDTTEFIADGMLQNVEADVTNNKLIFTWNTNNKEGKTVTEIELDKIADIYTGSQGEDITINVSNENVISATLNKTFAEKSELDNYKSKQEAYSAEGSTIKTITKIEQNSNGEVAVTYGEIAFPDHAEAFNGKKDKQTAISDPTADGKTLAFIDSISQNENGEITATKKNVNLDDYALKSELPTDFGVTKITSNDTTSGNDSNVSGLKVTPVEGTGVVNIEIDDTITFIFNCGGAE